MKKGNVGVTKLIVILIAAAFIVLVIPSVLFGGSWSRILNIIPDYNETHSVSGDVEILRYDIAGDKVQYRDEGDTIYSDFPKDSGEEIKIGTKNISHNAARYYFSEYYFGKNFRQPKEAILSAGSSYSLYPEADIPKDFCLYISNYNSFNRNGLVIELAKRKLNEKNQKVCDVVSAGDWGKFILKNDNLLYFVSLNKFSYKDTGLPVSLPETDAEDITKKLPEVYKEVSGFGISWLDSILSQPMQFKYNNNKDCILVKVQKTANNQKVYLAADLVKDEVGKC